MAELISVGTSEATSLDITLAAGASTTLYLKSATAQLPPAATADVQIKSGLNYYTVGQLTYARPLQVLAATGVFRVVRNPSGTAFGVDQN